MKNMTDRNIQQIFAALISGLTVVAAGKDMPRETVGIIAVFTAIAYFLLVFNRNVGIIDSPHMTGLAVIVAIIPPLLAMQFTQLWIAYVLLFWCGFGFVQWLLFQMENGSGENRTAAH